MNAITSGVSLWGLFGPRCCGSNPVNPCRAKAASAWRPATGDTKQRCGCSLLCPLDAHLPEHLVFHLDQIAGVEETVALEQGGADSFRMPVQGALLLQALGFGIALVGQDRIPGSRYVSIYTPL